MNCFQLVKTVLDELYVRIPANSDDEKDARILRMIEYLDNQYDELAQGVAIDYSDITTKFAYIYKYVTSHANFVHQVIARSSDLAALFESEKVNVTCIGGGPGSDFLGILKYVLRSGKKPALRCTLFDREVSWAECWNDVDDKLAHDLRISTFFQPFDVTETRSWSSNSKYLNSDLFTMIYFMSEVYSLRSEAEPFFINLIERVKPGALFLFIDNYDQRFYGWFDSLARAYSLDYLQEDRLRMMIDDFSEEKTDLAEYWDKFGPINSPRLRGSLAFRVCRKV